MIARLQMRWNELNARHFGGILATIPIALSSRMRRRLGELVYDRTTSKPVRIVISRRLLKRHPWREVEETLLHEMVHHGRRRPACPGDHGPAFRRRRGGGDRAPRGDTGAWACGSLWARVERMLGARAGRRRSGRYFRALANLRHCHGER